MYSDDAATAICIPRPLNRSTECRNSSTGGEHRGRFAEFTRGETHFDIRYAGSISGADRQTTPNVHQESSTEQANCSFANSSTVCTRQVSWDVPVMESHSRPSHRTAHCLSRAKDHHSQVKSKLSKKCGTSQVSSWIGTACILWSSDLRHDSTKHCFLSVYSLTT